MIYNHFWCNVGVNNINHFNILINDMRLVVCDSLLINK